MNAALLRNIAIGSLLVFGLSSCAWLSRVFRPYPEDKMVVPYQSQSQHPYFPQQTTPLDGGQKKSDQRPGTFTMQQPSPTPPVTDPEPAPKPAKKEYPLAKTVKGRPGFVLNPYTGNLVDVTGMAAGTLVRDPADEDQTHIFRVPPME